MTDFEKLFALNNHVLLHLTPRKRHTLQFCAFLKA